MAENVLGLNIKFPIYSGDDTPFHNLVINKSVVDSIVMSLGDKITGDVYYRDNNLQVTMQEYIIYNGVRYTLVSPPVIVREGMVSDNSELKGMTKYSLTFYHPMYQLGNLPFADVAVTNDEKQYLSENKVFSWIGKPDDFIAKLNKNLQGTQWIAVKSDRFPQDKEDELSEVIPFDNAKVSDALKTWYDTWGVPYVIDKVASTEASYASGKRFKIVMGLPSNEIYESEAERQLENPFVFQFGKGVGLKNNSRTPRNNKIITRLAGYGSENNIPYGYPQILWYGTSGLDFTYGDHAGVYNNVTIGGHTFSKIVSYPIYKGILGGAYVELIKHPFTRTHLMPSVYRTTLFNKISFLNEDGSPNTSYNPDLTLVDFYDAVYSAQYPYPNPINIDAPSYDSHEFGDIKPELGEAHIVAATPVDNNLQPVANWDDSIDDEGNFNQSYFQITLPRLSFDIYACAAITEEMEINMRSGACLGCTFPVQVDWDDYKINFYDSDGNFVPNGPQRNLEKYPKSNLGSINIIVQKDNNTFGTLMPNIYQYPKGETSTGADNGDTFVVLGISLPDTYITEAEGRLDENIKSYMLENNVHYYDYPLKFDEHFLAKNTNILSQVKPNTVIRFDYAGEELQLFVKQLTVKYGENVLPQYDITLTDNVEVTLNQIGQVADDVEKLSTLISILRQNYSRNVWNELSKKLSKVSDDTAQGYIKMLKGIQVGAQYVPDILGEGGVFRKEANGKVSLVTDYLYARVKAYFDTIEVKKYLHSGGNRVASKAGFKCVRVEWYDANGNVLEPITGNLSSCVKFRCYYRATDGDEQVTNDFEVGDLAYCREVNASLSGGQLQHAFHRLVIAKDNGGSDITADGEGWIDLSNKALETITIEIGGESQTYTHAGYSSTLHDDPLAQDDIVQLGNIATADRQGAIIEFVGGTDAPSYQIYQGIDDYDWDGKLQIGFGFNSLTHKAYMNVYGDAYIGDPNGSTYIEYKQDDGTQQHNPVLNIKAKINAQSTIGNQSLSDYVNGAALSGAVGTAIDDLQSQIDGEIDSWFYNYMPVAESQGAPVNTVPLTNVEPYKTWYEKDHGGTASEVNTERIKHLSDVFYDNSSGYAFRFSNTGTEQSPVFAWVVIQDSAVIKALEDAAKAQETADGKRTIYSVWGAWVKDNVNTLKQGDLFIPTADTTQGGTTYKANKVYKCTTDGTASFQEVAYTDDSAFNGYINAVLNGTGSSGDAATVAAAQKAIKDALGGGTVVDGGLLLTSLIAMRKYNETTQQYKTWAGISGTYQDNETGTGYKGHGIAAWYGGAMVDKEVQTTATDYAKSLFRFDGSGYLAGGNISWDKNGIVTIANVYADVNGTDVSLSGSLQSLAAITNALPLRTINSVVYLDPQYGFSNLSVLGNSVWHGGNHPTTISDYGIIDAYTKSEVYSKTESDNRYITISFFDRLFRAYNGSTMVNHNDTTTTIDNIKAMFGFWTEQYISALGQSSSGGGGGASTLDDLLDVEINSNTLANGQVLKYDASTHKWYNGTDEGVTTIAWANITGKPTDIAGYGITDAYISNGTIKLGGNTITPLTSLPSHNHDDRYYIQNGVIYIAGNSITPLTSLPAHNHDDRYYISNGVITLGGSSITPLTTHQTLYTLSIYGGSTKVLDFKPDANASIYIKAGDGLSLTNDTTNKYITLSHPTNGANTTIAAASGKVLSAITVNNLGHVTSVASKSLIADDIPTLAISKISGLQTALDSKLDIAFFSALFKAYAGTTEVTPNNATTNVDNIKAMFGFWTQQYISALGQSSGSSGGGVDMTTVWTALANNTTEQINISHLSTALSGYSLTSHTHPLSIAASSGTNALTLAASTKYVLTAGGSSFIFTTPPNTTYSAATQSVAGLMSAADKVKLDGIATGATANTGTVTSITLKAGTGISLDTDNTAITTSGTRTISLATSGVTAGTYKRVTVDSYGRVTSGDNADADTWRNIYTNGTSRIGTGSDTKAMNLVSGSGISVGFAAAGTGTGQSGNANYFNLSITNTGVRAVSINGDNLRVNTNGSDSDLTIPYASTAGSVAWGNVTGKPLTLTANATGFSISGGTTSKTLTVSESYTLAAACAKAVTDSSSASAIGTGTSLPTERDIYYGLPTINNAHNYTSSTTIYAPTAGGTANQVLIAQGATSTPTWTNQSNLSVGSATTASKLSTVSQTAWGQTYWTSGGVPTSISGAISSTGNITPSATDTSNLGSSLLRYNTLYVKEIYIGGIQLKVENDAVHVVSKGLYADTFISALGASSGGSGGGVDMTTVWTALNTADSDPTHQINISHLSTALSGYSLTSHTHATSIATSSGTNQLTLAFGTKYALTAGGTSYVFTMPSNPNTNTTYKFTIGSTTKGDSTNGVDLGTLKSETAVASGTTLSLVTTGEKATWNAKTSNTGTVTSITLKAGTGISLDTDNTAITTSGTRTITNSGVRATTINGDYLRVNTNGTDADLTIPYASKAGVLAYKSNITTSDDLDAFHEAYKLKVAVWTGFNTSILNGNGIVIDGGYTSATYGFQLLIDDDPTYVMGLRQRGGNGWNAWKRIPMGDGTGASGTWGISITGSAGSVAWANVSSHPTKLSEFTNDSGYITSSGSCANADTVDNYHATQLLQWKAQQNIGANAPYDYCVTYLKTLTNLNNGAQLMYSYSGDEYTLLFTRRNDATAHGTVLKWGYHDAYIRMIRMISGNAQTTDWEKINAGYADSAGSVTWSNVSSKPSAAGGATTPVYWTGSGFTACTAYASASVNYATTAGSAPASDVYAWAKASTKPSYTHNEIGAGDLTIGDGANRINLRTNGSWETAIYHQTSADECVVFLNKGLNVGGTSNYTTSWIFAYGNPSSRPAWNTLTPALQIKGQCVAINKLIGSKAAASYNLDVNGSIGATTSAYFCTTSGSVGIGTTSPSYKLHVNGTSYASNLYIEDDAEFHGDIYAYSGLDVDGNASIQGRLGVGGSYSSGNQFYVNGTSYLSGATTVNGSLSVTNNIILSNNYGLYIKNSSSSNINFLLMNSGNACVVGYGVRTSGYTLQVAGDSILFRTGQSTDTATMRMYNTYIQAYVGFYSDSYVSAMGQNTSSDIRKKDVEDYAALVDINDIANAPAIHYTWKDKKNLGRQAGSIAQYWQRYLPESVHQDHDGYLSMQYDVISLLSAISIAKKVVDHERRISELEHENELLRKQINELKIA